MGGGGRSGARIVEGEERRRPAERRGERVLVETIRLVVGRDPRMRVDVDATGQDEEPRRVDDLSRASSEARQVRLDRLDPPAADGDIGKPRASGRDDRAADDEEVRSGCVDHDPRIAAPEPVRR